MCLAESIAHVAGVVKCPIKWTDGGSLIYYICNIYIRDYIKKNREKCPQHRTEHTDGGWGIP